MQLIEIRNGMLAPTATPRDCCIMAVRQFRTWRLRPKLESRLERRILAIKQKRAAERRKVPVTLAPVRGETSCR